MKNFNFIAPMGPTGYGHASLGFLRSLLLDNPNIAYHPIGNPDLNMEGVKDTLALSKGKVDPQQPSFCFWHLHDMPNKILKGPTIGYSTFELDTLHPAEITSISSLNSVATASEWGKTILSKYTNKPIHIIRHAFLPDSSTKLNKLAFDYSANYEAWSKFLFPIKLPSDSLFLSTAGKFESRKSHPELIQACIEYGKRKPIVLIAFIFNIFIPDHFPYNYINYNMLYPVYTNSGIKVYKKDNFYLVLMPPALKKEDYHSALSTTHFFVSPSKAEGWNLPLFEMMSLGMPCLTTLYSAHTEYCNSENVVSVDYDGLAIAKDGVFFNGNGYWANVTKNNILNAIEQADGLRYNKSFIQRLSHNAIESTSKFTWQKEARKIQSLMNQL